MDGSEACLGCGFGEELQPLEVWRDADGEGHWIHPSCLAARQMDNGTVALLTPAAENNATTRT